MLFCHMLFRWVIKNNSPRLGHINLIVCLKLSKDWKPNEECSFSPFFFFSHCFHSIYTFIWTNTHVLVHICWLTMVSCFFWPEKNEITAIQQKKMNKINAQELWDIQLKYYGLTMDTDMDYLNIDSIIIILQKPSIVTKSMQKCKFPITLVYNIYIRLNRVIAAKVGHTRLKIWYKPCIIRQFIHSKTAANHVLFASSYTAKQLQTIYYSLNQTHK